MFKNYYDGVGKEYINKNAKKLRNILEKDYYEMMLKYARKQLDFNSGIIVSCMYNDIKNIKRNIDLERLDNNTSNDNLYIEMVTQIIGIEVNIYELLKNNNIKPEENIVKNLELLFEVYKKNEFYRNALMFIYFVLYCQNGYQLRDQIMHGDLINQNNYGKELIMIYACMIVINFMVSHS